MSLWFSKIGMLVGIMGEIVAAVFGCCIGLGLPAFFLWMLFIAVSDIRDAGLWTLYPLVLAPLATAAGYTILIKISVPILRREVSEFWSIVSGNRGKLPENKDADEEPESTAD